VVKFIRGSSLQEKFNERCGDPDENGCIPWTGRTNNGYGAIDVYSKEDQQTRGVPAHRVAWLLAMEDDPAERHVLHQCDNRACVNVDHLMLGTNGDNVRDKMSKARKRRHLAQVLVSILRDKPELTPPDDQVVRWALDHPERV
jgi:hypothetical protein